MSRALFWAFSRSSALRIHATVESVANFTTVTSRNTVFGQTSHALCPTPPAPNFTIVAGMKYRRALKLMCKDCYYVVNDRTLYVLCKTHPRHRQQMIKAPEKHKWIWTEFSCCPNRGF